MNDLLPSLVAFWSDDVYPQYPNQRSQRRINQNAENREIIQKHLHYALTFLRHNAIIFNNIQASPCNIRYVCALLVAGQFNVFKHGCHTDQSAFRKRIFHIQSFTFTVNHVCSFTKYRHPATGAELYTFAEQFSERQL